MKLVSTMLNNVVNNLKDVEHLIVHSDQSAIIDDQTINKLNDNELNILMFKKTCFCNNSLYKGFLRLKNEMFYKRNQKTQQ